MLTIASILHWNFNVGRKGKLSKDGVQLYKTKVLIVLLLVQFKTEQLQVDRTGKKTTVVEVKEKKDYSYQDSILKECLECLENDNIPEVNVGSFNVAL